MVLMVMVVMIVMMVLMFLFLIVIMMVMVVLMLLFLIVVMMVMMVFVLLFPIVIMVVMMAAPALFFLIIVVMVVMLVSELFHGTLQAVFFHGGFDLLTGNSIPRCGDQPALGIEGAQQFRCGKCFGFIDHPRTAEDNQVGILNLVVEKFAEVAHIDFALAGIYHGHLCTDFNTVHGFHSLRNIRQFSDAGRLNDNTVRCKFFHDLLKSFPEVPDKGTADASGIHLRDFDPGIFQECTVNGDIAEFVFNQNKLLTLIGFRNQLTNQGSLPCSQKTTENICFCHFCLNSCAFLLI